jgi:hypothetical protein
MHLGRTQYTCSVSYSVVPLQIKSQWSNQVSFVDLGDFGTEYGNVISAEYAYLILEIEIDSESSL